MRYGKSHETVVISKLLVNKTLNKLSFDKVKPIIKKKRCITFYPIVNFIGPIKYFETKFY